MQRTPAESRYQRYTFKKIITQVRVENDNENIKIVHFGKKLWTISKPESFVPILQLSSTSGNKTKTSKVVKKRSKRIRHTVGGGHLDSFQDFQYEFTQSKNVKKSED